MNDSHQNNSSSNKSKPTPWQFSDLIVIGLWLAIPAGVIAWANVTATDLS